MQVGNGTANFTQSPVLVQQYVQQALSALSAPQLSQPQLSVNGTTNSSDPAVAAAAASIGAGAGAGATADVVVSCLAPPGAQDVVPAVLWDLANSDGSPGAVLLWGLGILFWDLWVWVHAKALTTVMCWPHGVGQLGGFCAPCFDASHLHVACIALAPVGAQGRILGFTLKPVNRDLLGPWCWAPLLRACVHPVQMRSSRMSDASP